MKYIELFLLILLIGFLCRLMRSPGTSMNYGNFYTTSGKIKHRRIVVVHRIVAHRRSRHPRSTSPNRLHFPLERGTLPFRPLTASMDRPCRSSPACRHRRVQNFRFHLPRDQFWSTLWVRNRSSRPKVTTPCGRRPGTDQSLTVSL